MSIFNFLPSFEGCQKSISPEHCDNVDHICMHADDHPLGATINSIEISPKDNSVQVPILLSLKLLTILVFIPHFSSAVCAIVHSASTNTTVTCLIKGAHEVE